MGYIGKVTDTFGNTHLVGSTLFGRCSTAANQSTKVVTCPDFVEAVDGVTIHIEFEYNNTADELKLSINGIVDDANDIYWGAGDCIAWTYNATGEVWLPNVGEIDEKVKQSPSTHNAEYPILIKHSANWNEETKSVSFGNTSDSRPTINPSTGNISAPTFNSYTLDAACEKGVDTALGSGATNGNVPTSAAVVSYVASAVSGGTAFQGSLVQTDSGSSAVKWTQAELEASSYVKGWYWVCEEAGTYAGNVLEAGDMLFAVLDKGGSYSASDFTAVQNNIETLTTTEVSTLWTNAVAVS